MRRSRSWWYALLLAGSLLVAGCGAEVTVYTKVAPDLSGERSFVIDVDADDLSYVRGGETALTRVLKGAAPGGLSLAVEYPEQGSVRYRLAFEFSSPEVLRTRSAQVLGKSHPGLTLERGGTPFSTRYTFEDKASTRDYFAWAVTAVQKAGLIDSASLSSASARVWLPGADGWRSADYGRAESYLIHPVEHLALETVLGRWGSVDRTLTLRIGRDVEDAIRGARGTEVPAFIAQLGFEGDASRVVRVDEGEVVDYVVSWGDRDPAKVQETSEKLFGRSGLAFSELERTSFLRPARSFEDRLNLTAWLGEGVPLKQDPTYVLRLPPGSRVLSSRGVDPTPDRLVYETHGSDVVAAVEFDWFAWSNFFLIALAIAVPVACLGVVASRPRTRAAVGEVLAGLRQAAAGTRIPGQTAVRRRVSAAVFALIVLTFFLPWVHLSCAGEPLGKATGFDLLTAEPASRESREAMSLASELIGIEQPPTGSAARAMVTLVLIGAIAGAVLVFVIPRERTAFGVATALGACQLIFLAGFVSAVRSEIARATSWVPDAWFAPAEPLIQVRYEAGFYLAFALAMAATLWGGYALLGHGATPVGEETSGAGRSPPAAVFCPQCGLRGSPEDAFCTACGTRLQ